MIESVCNIDNNRENLFSLKYKEKTDEALMHPYIIIRVNKHTDDWLIDDMKHIITTLSHLLQDTTTIETMSAYYIATSVSDLQILCYERTPHNIFISELTRITKNVREFNSENVGRPIKSIPNLDFQILNDMRLFSRDYMKLYEYTDLSRDELNSLYRLTVRFKVPLHMMTDICRKFKLNTIADINITNPKYRLTRCENNDNITLRLSTVAKTANVNPDLVTFTTNPNKIMEFIDYTCKFIHSSNVDNLTQLGTFGFVTLTITIKELIQFLTPVESRLSFKDEIPSSPKYYKYFNALSQLLLYNNIFMEFILLGKERK